MGHGNNVYWIIILTISKHIIGKKKDRIGLKLVILVVITLSKHELVNLDLT